MDDLTWGALATMFGALLVYLANRYTTNANRTAVDVRAFQSLVKQVEELSEKINRSEQKNSYLWSYVIALLEDYDERNIDPPAPPKALESDPLIRKFYEKRKSEPKIKPVESYPATDG
jgi:hypothetical protein